ncbi:MAG: protein-glutamate O-methyltransferase CheR [Geobacteraceae bacterium]|nr:protein-glutamate O-methyltransferase CheR [Geobacteraceae bacterium]
MEEALLDTIAHFVQKRSRLCFREQKRSILRQRLTERLTHLGMPGLADYWGYLRNSAKEEPILLDLLTINETSFFRNPGQFRFLTERIVPTLEKTRGEEVIRSWGRAAPAPPGSIMKLRILCAGCSTGEEPYSVAMALFATLRYPRAWDIEILAGDLSDSCIRTAAAGYYDAERLKGLPATHIDRYMERRGNGAVVKDEIKGLIRFCRLNLNDVINGGPLPGPEDGNEPFDIIFCRNVMIYFSPETQQQLVDTLFRLLVPGGYLFTGDAEPLHLYDHEFAPVPDAGCLIYRKMEA